MRWLLRSGLLLMCLALAVYPATRAHAQLLPTGDATASQPAPDPYGRETPRSAVTGLLRAFAEQNYEVAAQYLAVPARQEDQAAALALALRNALNSGGSLKPYAELSNDPAGTTGDGLAPDLDQIGILSRDTGEPILLQRFEAEGAAPVWQISAETLQLLEPTPQEAQQAAEPVPDTSVVAGAPLADWLTLIGILLIVFVGFWVISSLILWLLRRTLTMDSPAYHLLNAALPPLALFLSFVVFRIFGEDAPVSIIARQTLLRYLGILGVVALVWFLLRLVDAVASWLTSRMERADRRQAASVIVFARRVIKVILLALALIGVLDTLGFNVTTGVAALGIGGLVLALGAQKSVENLVGTVSVLADRPIQVGDVCKVGGVIGTVEDIGIRSTRIRTTDRTVVTIPNGDFSSERIENYSQRDRHLFRVVIGLEYSLSAARLRQALNIIKQVLAEHPKVAEDARATLKDFAPDSLAVETFAYIDVADYTESVFIRQELLLEIYRRLEEADVGFAFPTRTLYLRQAEADA